MGKVRILQIVGSLDYGGIEKMAAGFIKDIDRERFQIDYMIFTNKKGIYEDEVSEYGGQIIRIEKPSKSYIKYVKNIYRIYKEGKYDVVHSHTMLNNGINLLIARICNVKMRISHVHSTSIGRSENLVYKIYKLISLLTINLNATKIIACGKKAGKKIYGENFLNKGIILNNAIDTKKYEYDYKIRNEVREELGIKNEVLLGHIGRMTEVKNQLFLIEIMREFMKEKLKIKLVIVGEGELRGEIERKIKEYNLKENIVLTGERDDVDKLLQGIDMLIFPSLYEGLPVTLVEAQTAGVRCLVSTGVTKEAKITNLVEYFSLEKNQKEWMKKIIENLEYKRESKVSEMMESGYDIKENIKKLEDIYTEEGNLC